MSRRQTYSRNRTAQAPYSWRLLLWVFLSLFLTGFFAYAAKWSWVWMQKPTSFPIKQVIIEGQLTHVPLVTIQKIMQTQLSGGFFSLDVSAAKQAILAEPWVNHVSFRRMWPDKLIVRLKEQEAVARFGKKGVLNANGLIFYPDLKSVSDTLPLLEGPTDQAEKLFNFYQTANALVKLLGLSIVALHVNADQDWDLILSNQVRVTLGRHLALPRLKRFITIYPKITALSQRQMTSVDLRYPNGVAVQYAQSS